MFLSAGSGLMNTKTHEGKKHRVLLVDDHPVVRQGLATMIDQDYRMAVCGACADAISALKAVEELSPDIVLTDIAMPGVDGITLVKELKEQFPEVPVVVLSMHDEALYAERALRAGAHGYVMKHTPLPELLEAVHRVLHGEMSFSASVTARILRQSGDRAEGASTPSLKDLLSDRELQLFRMLGEGKQVRQIADELNLSGKTVETHLRRIREKLRLPDLRSLERQAILGVQQSPRV